MDGCPQPPARPADCARCSDPQRSAARARELSNSPPGYLIAEIGEPTGKGDIDWQQAAGEIESYRARWAIDYGDDALPTPTPLAKPHRDAVRESLVALGFSVGIDGMHRT